MRQINRRESPRIEIRLRCYITAPVWMRNATYTENISRHGLVVAWRNDNGVLTPPRAGQIVTIEVELPATHAFGPKCIHCQGSVIRITEGETGEASIALRLNYMDFRSFEDQTQPASLHESLANAWMA